MRVDSIHSNVNLQKLKNRYPKIFAAVNKDVLVMEVLTYLEILGISINDSNDNDYKWSIGQESFFKIMDLVSLCSAQDTTDIMNNSLSAADIVPFRKHLALSSRATLGFLRAVKIAGLTDDMCAIDNFNNVFRMTNEGLYQLLKLIQNAMSYHVHKEDSVCHLLLD